ncbi:MAG TPA: family 16 glycosylhydrolase [Flavobacterium sp.]|nr:family 16 glycosylhydrolase [Flavobacterium sp.]
MKNLVLSCFFISMSFLASSQVIEDNFEGTGNITSWLGDDCGLEQPFSNPFQTGINPSANVLKYNDIGGQYANVRFDATTNFNLSANYIFKVKIFVPASGMTDNQPLQISLKLQDGLLSAPWSTQSEIIKSIVADQWQEVTFNFASDPYINLDPASLPPINRADFNRVLLQINGENNTSKVLAYIDDFYYLGASTPSPAVFYQLVWSDEFDTNGAVDASKWFHQTQIPAGGSWHNGEVQHYTNRIDNSVVNNGFLNIIAKKETYQNQGVTKSYTSARLNSKFAFKYGRVEVRAKLPAGLGTWPAIWTLGKNVNENGAYWDLQGFCTTSWPACGEIDIMEHWGTNQNFAQSAMHTPSSFGGTINKGGQIIPTVSTAYHIYSLDWYANKMVFSVDGIVHYTYQPETLNSDTWPFDEEQYLLLNFAIESSIYPSFTQGAMEVDYVRVYQEKTLSTNENAATKVGIQLCPNPVQDVLTVHIPADFIGAKITIVSMQGQELANFISKEAILTINTSAYKSGVYLMRFSTNNESVSYKFIKK